MNRKHETDRSDETILNLHDLWRSIQGKYSKIETLGVEERVKGNEFFSLQPTESDNLKFVIIIIEIGNYPPLSAGRVEYTFDENENTLVCAFKKKYNAFFVEGDNNFIMVDHIHSLYYDFPKEIILQDMAERILGDEPSFLIHKERYSSFDDFSE